MLFNNAISTFIPRSRLWLLIGLAAVIACGLSLRTYPFLFPSFMVKYPGDALWALMVFLGWALIKPYELPARLAGFALATSYIVELSQLYQSPWINSIRATTIGHLVLGSTFSMYDMYAYTVGIAFGYGVDALRSQLINRKFQLTGSVRT